MSYWLLLYSYARLMPPPREKRANFFALPPTRFFFSLKGRKNLLRKNHVSYMPIIYPPPATLLKKKKKKGNLEQYARQMATFGIAVKT